MAKRSTSKPAAEAITPKKETREMSEANEMMYEFSEDISTATPPPPLPIATYEAEIRQVEPKVSNTSGSRYAAVHFVILPDQFPADFEAAEDYPEGVNIIYRRVSLEDDRNSRARLRSFLEAIGAPMGKSIDLSDWIGHTARVSVASSEWDGNLRNEITSVSAAD